LSLAPDYTSVDGIPFLLDDDRFLDDAKEAYNHELPEWADKILDANTLDEVFSNNSSN
jgi:hypothetical protein